MNYDPQYPIAVFLGPSLENLQAAQILTANYYPPARMGDIYRLLGTGIRMIVLIDGIFHNEASVWQRELLEALDNNICLIGAASLGALRAAELSPFGMIGHGTIFEWYCDGVIDGDDEVALHHADAANQFRPFSEPLVNIRYNLLQAARLKYISKELAMDLIAYAKRTFYADRSYEMLVSSPTAKKWPQAAQDRLAQFVSQESVNLKKQDAVSVLKYCADLARARPGQVPTATPLKTQSRYYRSTTYLKRGFWQSGGCLINGKTLLARVSEDTGLIETLRPELIKAYFLLLWAKQNKLTCPQDYLKTFQQTWKRAYLVTDQEHWLRANGLTLREFQAALEERALLQWLIQQGPESFDLDTELYNQFGELLPNFNAGTLYKTVISPQHREKTNHNPGAPGGFKHPSEICYLATWARENGIRCPPVEVETFIKNWEKDHQICGRATWLAAKNMTETNYLSLLAEWAGACWLIERGPGYFGFTSWSFEVALLKELQITGRAAEIADKIPSC